MPAKGKGRGSKKTQENVVDSTTNLKSDEKIESAIAVAQNNADKKSVAIKRKQTKKDTVENGAAEIPTVPEKRGRGRPPVIKTTEQPALASSANKKEEHESPPGKQQKKGKKGGRKGILSATTKSTVAGSETKEKDKMKGEESESETKAIDDATSADDDEKSIQAKRGRKKAPNTSNIENDESNEVKGVKRGAAASKKEKQVTNGDVEEVVEPVKKGRGKAKKESENGENPVKTVGKRTVFIGGRGRKRVMTTDADLDTSSK